MCSLVANSEHGKHSTEPACVHLPHGVSIEQAAHDPYTCGAASNCSSSRVSPHFSAPLWAWGSEESSLARRTGRAWGHRAPGLSSQLPLPPHYLLFFPPLTQTGLQAVPEAVEHLVAQGLGTWPPASGESLGSPFFGCLQIPTIHC